MKNFKGQTFLFLGKSGSGKDTQAEKLISLLKTKKLHVLRVSTGDLGRKAARKNNLIGRWIGDILKRGGFFPFWAQAGLWFGFLQNRLKKDTVVFFPSSPRRLEEARALDEVMVNLGRSLPVPIYLDISDGEAGQRLLKRGRGDDRLASIRERLNNFHRLVFPIVKAYGRRVVKINGEGQVDEVRKRLFDKLKKIKK